MYFIKLNLKKLDKERLFHGQAGIYADLVAFETKDGKFLIKQSVSKQEREAGIDLPIVGDMVDKLPERKPAAPQTAQDDTDDLPF
jgi:hypothetical protein